MIDASYDETACLCPKCNGFAFLLGTMGGVTWLQCRSCGWAFMTHADLDAELFNDYREEE